MVFSYIDNKPSMKPSVTELIKVVEIVDIIEVEEVVVKEYDFTWVYITAGCVTPIVIVVIVYLCKSCKK